MQTKIVKIIILSCVLINVVFAQTSNSLNVTAYGNFSNMMTTGNAMPHVALSTLQNQHNLYGVGALAGLEGEIMIMNGAAYVSYGINDDGRTQLATANDNATMLVTASVKTWKAVKIPPNISSIELQNFVLEQAALSDIGRGVPFPFIVKGNFKIVKWHVVKELKLITPDGKTHPVKKNFNTSNTLGVLLGFYVSPQLEGVVSHPGNLFHIHYADENFKHVGHVDDYAVGPGAILLLPSK